MQRERVASRGGLRGYGNCYAMLDQAKKNLTPTTRDGGEEEGWGVTCVLFFLTNKIQKLYAVGCQDLANGQQHKKGTGDKGGGGQGMLRVIRIRWRIPCGDTEYLTSAWKRKRKPNGASVAQFNLFPARLQPTQSLSRSGSPPANLLFSPRSAQSLNTRIYRFIKMPNFNLIPRDNANLSPSPQVNSFRRTNLCTTAKLHFANRTRDYENFS